MVKLTVCPNCHTHSSLSGPPPARCLVQKGNGIKAGSVKEKWKETQNEDSVHDILYNQPLGAGVLTESISKQSHLKHSFTTCLFIECATMCHMLN